MKAQVTAWSFLLVCLLVSCTQPLTSPSSPVPTTAIELKWAPLESLPSKTSYEVGESFFYALGIFNHTTATLEPNWVYCRHLLAFDDPLRLYLLAPNGEDLLDPYHQRMELSTPWCPDVRIPPGESYGRSMGFTRWIHPRHLGTYRLGAEYIGPDGTLYTSNIITFEIQSVPTSVSPTLIDVHLALDSSAYSPMALKRGEVYLTATFTNHANRPLIFLQPQEGSMSNLINPIYQFTVSDQFGYSLGMPPPDTQIGTPVYSTKTMFTLQPGTAYSIRVRLPYFPEMITHPDKYRIQLTYIVRTKAIKWGMVLEDEPMHWDDDVFTGVLESNVVTLTITTEDE